MGGMKNKVNMVKALADLIKIPGYGKMFYNGQHFSIKFRVESTQENNDKVKLLKSKHPELIIYYAKTQYTLFGGTFNKQCSFIEDKQKIMGS